MASAICYTKSGSVEKYEPNLWSMDSVGVSVIIKGPDTFGNYTVTPPSGYINSIIPTQFYCTTIYGGVRKTFYFKESIKEIVIRADVEFFTDNGILILLTFDNNEYLGNDKLHVTVDLIINNTLFTFKSVFFTIDKNSRPTLRQELYIKLDPNMDYSAKTSCQPMEGKNYRVVII